MLKYKKYNGNINNEDKLTYDELKSFRCRDSIRTILLQKGTILYRFINDISKCTFSAFWIDRETFEKIAGMPYFDGFTDEARELFIRNLLGIRSDWSNLNYIVKIKLKDNVIGYYGLTKNQQRWSERDAPRVLFGKTGKILEEAVTGSEYQLVIPKLRKQDKAKTVATVCSYIVLGEKGLSELDYI